MLRLNITHIKHWLNIVLVIFIICTGTWQLQKTTAQIDPNTPLQSAGPSDAAAALKQLAVKGRAPKTGYVRAQFSNGWGKIGTCDARNYVLAHDMTDVTYVSNTCKVEAGTLADPYTGKIIRFQRGNTTSDAVQIDHVVALGDAWQKGAQQLSPAERYSLANDPLELLAVDGQANQDKGDSDAASWLPPNKDFRCSYVARQIAVKTKYRLWVTQAEYNAIARVIANCPDQTLPEVMLPQTP